MQQPPHQPADPPPRRRSEIGRELERPWPMRRARLHILGLAGDSGSTHFRRRLGVLRLRSAPVGLQTFALGWGSLRESGVCSDGRTRQAVPGSLAACDRLRFCPARWPMHCLRLVKCLGCGAVQLGLALCQIAVCRTTQNLRLRSR